MVKLRIDNIDVTVNEGTTIMEAAASAGISIPHLCYWKGLNEIGACRVCVVEVEGNDRLVSSCNTKAEDGMVIYTNSPRVRLDRRRTVQLILSEHDCKCATCPRSGNCALQTVANDLNIKTLPYEENLEKQPWDNSFPLIRDSKKCIKCMRCIQVCDKIQGLNIWDCEGTGGRTTINVSLNRKITEADCAVCGQCITHCPVGALRERDDTEKLYAAIADPEKTVVVQIAPAVRAAWGEPLGFSREDAKCGKMFDALKKMGVDYVFDTVFPADLTIMEEGTEFVKRFTSGELKELPMFTSCCPGWIRFIKSQYPELVPQLSSAKSPMQMFGATIKTYFAKEIGVKPENIYSVAIMPCTAKKAEAGVMEFSYEDYQGPETDLVLTTRELDRMIKSQNFIPELLKDIEPDQLFREGTGAGVIFGATGGVMEAALRTAYFLVMGEKPPVDAFRAVRASGENSAVQEAEFKLGDITLRVAAVSGLGNARRLIDAILAGEKKYDFVEVMACPGGCVGGGGQPQTDGYEMAFERGKNLYFLDENMPLRYSHENPDIARLYENFYGEPNSHLAHELLHFDNAGWDMPLSPARDDNGAVIDGRPVRVGH